MRTARTRHTDDQTMHFFNAPVNAHALGFQLAQDVRHPETGLPVVAAGSMVTMAALADLYDVGADTLLLAARTVA